VSGVRSSTEHREKLILGAICLLGGGGIEFLLVDISDRSVPARDRAGLVSKRHRPRNEPAVHAIVATQTIFDLERLTGADRALPCGTSAIAIIGMDSLAPRGLCRLGFSAEISRPLFVEIVDVARGIRAPDHLRYQLI
jgi:hypothetical protein